MAHPNRSKRVPSTSVKRTGGLTGSDASNFFSVLTGGKAAKVDAHIFGKGKKPKPKAKDKKSKA